MLESDSLPSFSSAMGMIDWIHDCSPNSRPDSQPSRTPCFPDENRVVQRIADLTDRRKTITAGHSRSSPEESLSWAIAPSTDMSVTEEPALLASWAPFPGKSSTRETWVPTGIFLSIALFPVLMGAFSAVKIFWPSFIPETATEYRFSPSAY